MADRSKPGEDIARSRFTVGEAERLLPPAGTHPRSAAVYQHGSMLLKLFEPRGHDPQGPHTRDELYFVTQGSGWFVNGDQRYRFQTGDVLFVPAGVTHRFEDFSPELTVWVVFYGPEGGERE
ncbi:MAG TPA: cupin domain-containing protein [Burkholderiales bacterium]|nr:cupin domain-containing protein [Burkholderiales bacterium]